MTRTTRSSPGCTRSRNRWTPRSTGPASPSSPASGWLFWTSMKEEVAEGRTLLFATHYLEEADQAADRILVINRGRLLADGTPAEIKGRAGAKRLSFRLDRVDEPFLLGLPGLVNLEVRRDVVQIQTSDSDATLYAILDAGCRPRGIEVASLGLEQAFLAVTAEDDASARKA